MVTSDSLAARLIRLRVQAGLSQEQLAAAAKVSAQAISDIERGITLAPRLTTIERIVQALSLDASAGRELVSLRGLQGNPGHAAAGSPPDARPGADGNTAFAAANLSQAVTYLRVQQGLSVAELGRRSGLSARTIADIEAGRRKRIHPASAGSLAEVLTPAGEARKRLMDLASGAVAPEAARLGAAEPSGLPGRDQELAAVVALLADHRLVSLTGHGGVGKTVLARAVLALVDRPSVSMFLADVAAGEDLARAIALVGRFDESSGAEWVSQLDPLLPQDAVLLLDNLEHLGRAPTVIEEILSARTDIALLTTSRTSIELADAQELEVRPLRLAAASQVFLMAAEETGRPLPASVTPDVIEQICEKVDRLPLAITLAARWLRLMTPQEILARLDRPAEILRLPGALLDDSSLGAGLRHVAISRTVGWSLALVSDATRTLFLSLSAYPASWPLDLIEAIRPSLGVLDALDELLQARLVGMTADASGRTSYAMLQTIRDVGSDQLAADRELTELVLERHAAHLLTRARELAPALVTGDRTAALASCDLLALHVEGALRHLINARDQRAVGLVAVWWRYWKERGRYRSGLALMNEIFQLGARSDQAASLDVAEALYGAAVLGYLAGVNNQAAGYAADALARFRQLGDMPGIGNLMSLIGMMELHAGRVAAALNWYQRGLREVGEDAAPRAYATLLANIAPVHAALNDLPAARAAAEGAAARYQALGDESSVAAQLGNLGLWAARAGERDRATELLHECRDLLTALHDQAGLIEVHLELAKLDVDDGDAAAAQEELDTAHQFAELADDAWGDALADSLSAQLAVLAGDMASARRQARAAKHKGEMLGYQRVIVGAALAEASAAAWSDDLSDALSAAQAGLTRSDQADEAAIVSLALIVVAVRMDRAGPAAVPDELLELERRVRWWASTSQGRPYVIARLAARRRGFSLAATGPPGTLPPIKDLQARALAWCLPDSAPG